MTNLPPSRTADKIMIRLPDGMRDRLQARAAAKGNSVTAEVVSILSDALNLPNENEVMSLVAELRRVSRQKTLLRASLGELNERQAAIVKEIKAMVTPDLLEGTEGPIRESAIRIMEVMSEFDADGAD